MDKSNLGSLISNMGQSLLKVSVALQALKHNHCCGGGYYGNFGAYNNMSMMGSIFPGMGCGGYPELGLSGGCGGYMGMGMGGMDMSGVYAQITQGMSAESAYNSFMEKYNQIAKTSQNKKADAVDKGYETKTAENTNEKLGQMVDEDSEPVQISDLSSFTDKDKTKAAKQYKDDLTKLGKSNVAKMDTNKDGYISKEEYIKENAGGADESQIKNQFEAIDLNNDGVIDYKEMSSAFFAMDADKDGKSDGVINFTSFDRFNKNTVCDAKDSTNNSTKAEVDLMQKGWKKLFGSDE